MAIAATSIVLFLLYLKFILVIYVNVQANSLSDWLNNSEGSKPKVGPQASEHLDWLKKESAGFYNCVLVEPNYDFPNNNVKTILISKDGIEKMRLNYQLSNGIPTYFHHQTNFEHSHSH